MVYRVNHLLEVPRGALAKLKSISSHMDPNKTDSQKAYLAEEDLVGGIASLNGIRKMSQKDHGVRANFVFDRDGALVKRLGRKLPAWLRKLVVGAAAHFFEERSKKGNGV